MPAHADTLFTPHRERVITTNAWAFLHWLRTTHAFDLPDWVALRRFSTTEPARFAEALISFARLPAASLRLTRHAGPREALVLRRADGTRLAFSRDALANASDLPPEVATPLSRHWPPALLVRPLADVLLHADVRPDDRVLVAGVPAWPWLVSLLEGSTLILAPPSRLLAAAADERASVLIATSGALADAAFQRRGGRPDLAALRSIVATGGPLSPEARARVYTWIKADVMLLARSGETLWGSPLDPVLASPPASPGLLRPSPPASAPP